MLRTEPSIVRNTQERCLLGNLMHGDVEKQFCWRSLNQPFLIQRGLYSYYSIITLQLIGYIYIPKQVYNFIAGINSNCSVHLKIPLT